MGNLGIGGNAKSYGLGHLGVVQAFWDKEFPDIFRIVAFDMVAGLKPVFKGEGVRKYEVCVILNNGHWDGMKSVTQFFKVKYYCVSCEVTYDWAERHRLECKERCKNCCRMGFGFHAKMKEKFCKRCFVYHPGRQCFIKKHKIRPTLPVYRIVAYDLETTLVNGEHVPNLVSAAVTCSMCSGETSECEICVDGPRMLTCQNRLADLPRTLELDIPAKLYFPHQYNKNENFGKTLPHLPPFEDYGAEGMKEEDYKKFEAWYEENKNTEFELGEQLRIYCENDVEILMAAVLKFRKLFLGITKDMDVLKDSITIAGVVMKVFRAKTRPEDVPYDGLLKVKDVKECEHSEEERALLGTFTSIELRKALELGYKIKVEASGWPPEVKTEEEKQAFIDMYRGKYGIYLERENMKKNPGLRLIAKLGLNSLWGKFAMRNTLSTTEIVRTMERWMELCRDDTIEFRKPVKI
uniref:DNA-directed DNA polymerase n=1 Tax=Globodera pallida TaxID=36090 RepID=A0A183CJ26_GLOPA